jgi:hypothetical protein
VIVATRIAGIPCQVEVGHFFRQPALGPRADSDWDCYGYTDLEFEVLDRRGRPAPWLRKKVTEADELAIGDAIADAYRAAADDARADAAEDRW